MAHLEKKGYRDYRVKWYWQIMANFRRFVDLWGEDYKELFFEFLPDIKVGRNNVECQRNQAFSGTLAWF